MRAILEGFAGISKVSLELDRDAVTISYDGSVISLKRIQTAIRFLGFRAVPAPEKRGLAKPPSLPRNSRIPEPVAAALKRAGHFKRPLFVNFHADWCAPCRAFEEQIFPNPRVQTEIKGYEILRVDTDEFPDAGRHYSVTVMPTLLILNVTGEELGRKEGFIDADALARWLASTKNTSHPN